MHPRCRISPNNIANRRDHVSENVDVDGRALLVRIRRLRARGETRKGIALLRDACLRHDGAAPLWTQLGALLAAHGRTEEARQALKHALWLRRISGDAPRMRSTQALIDRLILPTAA